MKRAIAEGFILDSEQRQVVPGDLAGARILVTGGAGFIGGALVRCLARSAKLVVFDRAPEEVQRAQIGESASFVEVRVGDVRDRDALERAADGCTHIIHLASVAGVDTVMKKPLETMEVITQGTINVLHVAERLKGLRRLLNFSTSEVFGDMAFKLSEGEPTALGAVGQSRWTYAVSKIMAEHLVFNYFKERGLPAASVRPFNIYGPGQIGPGAIHHFIARAIRGEPLEIHNDGTQIRAWCYVDDMVDGVLLVLTLDAAAGNSFNIGNPRSTVTIYNLARLIKEITGSSSEIKFLEWPCQDIELRVPNVAKARTLLGFEPKVELHEGIALTAEWYRKRLKGERR
jgi:UDP-glucose 4-epimerase